ncbi:hypothetical protein LWF15_31055 [Kineosporia rhizophila]|uniref:hypothetical protein n=1 Tax=Kineosporia rhizophila TaxID=84633 RepID=UPI000AC3BB70|nr:hypothetical protein [Kineosporia rhizophila]MCE0539944.1 hypothetical protein [Kineosporia rhizophila]
MGNGAIVLTVELGVAVFAGLVSLLGGASVPVALGITAGAFVVAFVVGMIWKRMTASSVAGGTKGRGVGSSGAAGGSAASYDGGWSPPSDSSGGGSDGGGGGGSY